MLESEISRLLIAVCLLLSCALVLGRVFQKLYLPSVFGEIIAGLLLGPSIFGHYFPNNYEWVFVSFDPEGRLLSIFYHLGLIFLMLTAGLSIPQISSLKMVRNSIGLIIGALPIPFLIAFITAERIPNDLTPNSTAFKIVVACAASVTSIPVLSRIFIELDLISKNFASNVLTAAAFQDLILWTALSWAISLQNSQLTKAPARDYLFTFAITSFFLLISVMFLPRVFKLFSQTLRFKFSDSNLVGYSMLITLSIIVLANLLDISIVLGALVAGMALVRAGGNRMDFVKDSIGSFSHSFLIPIYFALVGLHIDLSSSISLLLIIEVLILTSIIKIASVAIVAKLTFKSWIVALDYGISMNARGGPGIILASLAFEAKIIDSALFTTFVFISLITSAIAGLWLRWRKNAI